MYGISFHIVGYDMSMLNTIAKPVICPRCMSGPSCNTPIINTCACNPCENFDDQCTSSSNPGESRTCVGTPDTTGNPFTLMFMQNRPDNTDKRELVRDYYFFSLLSVYLPCILAVTS